MSTLNSYCLRSKSISCIAIFSLIFTLVELCKIATTTFRQGDFNKRSWTLGIIMWRLIIPPPMHYMHKFIRFRRCANLNNFCCFHWRNKFFKFKSNYIPAIKQTWRLRQECTCTQYVHCLIVGSHVINKGSAKGCSNSTAQMHRINDLLMFTLYM